MTYKTLLIPAALLALAACGSGEPEVEVVGGPADPYADELANRAPVDPDSLPVSLGSDNYRCDDGVIARIDWTRTGETVSARVTPRGEGGTSLSGENGTYTAEGYTLSGGPDDESVTLNGVSCTK